MKRRQYDTRPTEQQDYLASVSDLMSGLVFIFIITIAVFSLRLAQAQHKLDETEQMLRMADAVRSEILERIRSELVPRGIRVEIDHVQGVLRLTDEAIGFELGRAEPRPPENVGTVANALLKVLAQYVACVRPPEVAAPRVERPGYCDPREVEAEYRECVESEQQDPRVDTVLIEGHTDSVAIRQPSKYKDNLELSAARSSAVLRMMVEECEPALNGLLNRSRQPVVSVSGYGETRLLPGKSGDDPAHRRIDLRFLMELPREEGSQGKEPEPIEATQKELSS